MSKEDLVSVRMFALLLIKSITLLILLFKLDLIQYSNSSEKKLVIYSFIIIVSLIIMKLVSYCSNNHTRISFFIKEKNVKIIYYFWHFITFFLLLIISHM